VTTCLSDFGIVCNQRDKAEVRGNIGKARLYRRRDPGTPFSMGQLREIEIVLKFVSHVFGATLPDDDFGREVLFEVLNQFALNGASPDELRECGVDLLPEVGDDDTLDDMVKKIGRGRKRKADDIARRLGVDYQLRTLLDLRSIGASDMSKREREAIQRQKAAADKRWKREQAGAKPHARSAAKRKPWLELGCSRSTYYARQKAAAENAKNSELDCFGSHTLSSFSSTNESEVINLAGPCPDTIDAEMEHGGEASDLIAEPLSQQERGDVVSEVLANYGADFSDEDMRVEGARRRLHEVASAVAASPDPERWQHLIVAAAAAVTRAKKANGGFLLDDGAIE